MSAPGPSPRAVAAAARLLGAAGDEPAWLIRRRLAAARAYALAGAGPPEDERPLLALEREGLGWLAERQWRSGAALAAVADAHAELVRVGARVRSVAAAAREDPARLRRLLGHGPRPARTRLGWLVEALFTGGELVEVPPGEGSALPIAPTALALGALGPFTRVIYALGEGAELRLVRGCVRPRLVSDPVRWDQVEVFLGEGARLELASLDHVERRAASRLALAARLGAGARLRWLAAPLGGAETAAEASVALGAGAEADIALLGIAGPDRPLALTATSLGPGEVEGARALARCGAVVADGGHAALRGALAPAGRGGASRREVDALLLGDDARVEVEHALARRGGPFGRAAAPDRSGHDTRLASVDARRAPEAARAAARALLGRFASRLPAPLDAELLAVCLERSFPAP